MGNLAALLHVNQNRIYAAIEAVGPRIADIRKHLAETPRAKPSSRFRRRRR